MNVLEGQTVINGKDIWKEFGAFLAEEKSGGRTNLRAILTPAKTKPHVAVDFREEDGERYSVRLTPASAARDVELTFALFAPTKAEWLRRYRAFIAFLKNGSDGWLSAEFPALGVTLRMFYLDSSEFRPLTYLWREGQQASIFRVKFREPNPSF